MVRAYLHTQYAEPMDFTGKNLIGLTDAPKDEVRAIIPAFRDASEMQKRWGFTSKLRTFNTGEIADEVHEFLNASQAGLKLTRILLKKGRVIELSIKY